MPGIARPLALPAHRREDQARRPRSRDAPLYEEVTRVARASIRCCMLGETGVGKEVLARAVHAPSPPRRGPVRRLNCAALTESLLESELFGHEKGAFTGATGPAPACSRPPTGGTVFLDEVGELPLAIAGEAAARARAARGRARRRRASRARSTCASSPRPTATSRPTSQRAASARICYFRLNGIALAHPAAARASRRIRAAGARVPRRARPASSIATSRRLSPEALARCSAYAGPATCASCAT